MDLRELCRRLGSQKIDSILLEGGTTLNWSALNAGIVQNIQAYIAPKLLGGDKAKSPIGGEGVQNLSHAWKLAPFSIKPLGEDLLLESEVLPCSQES